MIFRITGSIDVLDTIVTKLTFEKIAGLPVDISRNNFLLNQVFSPFPLYRVSGILEIFFLICLHSADTLFRRAETFL